MFTFGPHEEATTVLHKQKIKLFTQSNEDKAVEFYYLVQVNRDAALAEDKTKVNCYQYALVSTLQIAKIAAIELLLQETNNTNTVESLFQISHFDIKIFSLPYFCFIEQEFDAPIALMLGDYKKIKEIKIFQLTKSFKKIAEDITNQIEEEFKTIGNEAAGSRAMFNLCKRYSEAYNLSNIVTVEINIPVKLSPEPLLKNCRMM